MPPLDTSQTEHSTKYVLSDDEQSVLTAIRAEVQALEADAQTHLRNVARARGLNGKWEFDPPTNTFSILS